MGKVLVTGASGFIGGHLAEALAARGAEVRCLVRTSSDLSELQKLVGVEFVYGDVNEVAAVKAAVRGVEVVYHLAGLTQAFRKSDLRRVNERGTAAVAAACSGQPSPPVHIYVSSIAAGGPADKRQPRSESDPPAPVSHYGWSKLAGERAAAAWAHSVPTTIVRPGIVFGPRNRECFPIFRTIDRFGIHPVAGLRTPPLSYIDVDQLVDLLIRAAEAGSRIPGQLDVSSGFERGCYYASLDEFPGYAEFGRLIACALGRGRPFVLPVLMPLPFVAAAIHEWIARWRGQKDSFTVDKMREAHAVSWACSSKRAQRELGFRPTGTLLEHLQATVEWYREHGWLRTRRMQSAVVRKPVPSGGERVFTR